MNNGEIVGVLRYALKEGRLTDKILFDEKIELALIEAIRIVRSSSERYKWHDLRINPNDLPCAKTVCVCFDTDFAYAYTSAIHNGNNRWIFTNCVDEMLCKEVLAWKYIEPFEEEKNEKR